MKWLMRCAMQIDMPVSSSVLLYMTRGGYGQSHIMNYNKI